MRANVREIITRTRGEDGQALAEYALILALIALACIAILGALGLAISGSLAEFISAAGWGASSS
jgi:Flp pilus assembly pilin Flp